MGKCALCKNETINQVNDNTGNKSFLCSSCQIKFNKCRICGEYYYNEEINSEGICNYCDDNK